MPRQALFVFLPGGGSAPQDHDHILEAAASVGYRAIGLSFDTNFASGLQQVCSTLTSENDAQLCWQEGRHRAMTGLVDTHQIPGTPGLHVWQRDDSVALRLHNLLLDLVVQDPDGEWDRFLRYCENRYHQRDDPNCVELASPLTRWRKMIFAGWSGGAGLAQHIGVEERVHAVIMIEGVADGYNNHADFADLSTGDTAACNHWSIVHNNNSTATRRSYVVGQWDAIGLPTTANAPTDGLDLVDPADVGQSVIAGSGDRRFHISSTCEPDPHSAAARDPNMYFNSDCSGTPPTLSGNASTAFFLMEAYSSIFCAAGVSGGRISCP